MFREMGRKQKKASRSQGSKQGKLTAVNGLDAVGPYDNAMLNVTRSAPVTAGLPTCAANPDRRQKRDLAS
jgi:hypothetical protein